MSRPLVFSCCLAGGTLLGLIPLAISEFTEAVSLDDIVYYITSFVSYATIFIGILVYTKRDFLLKLAITPLFTSSIIYNAVSMWFSATDYTDNICQLLDQFGWICLFLYLGRLLMRQNHGREETSKEEERKAETGEEMRLHI